MQAVVIKFCFAIGSLVFIISRASDIRCIVTMGAYSLGGLPIMMVVATLCSSVFLGVRMALMAVARLLMRQRSLGVRAAFTVAVCNSLVSFLRCALGSDLGPGSVAGIVRPIPKCGTHASPGHSTNCTNSGQPKAPNTRHLFPKMPTILAQLGLCI